MDQTILQSQEEIPSFTDESAKRMLLSKGFNKINPAYALPTTPFIYALPEEIRGKNVHPHSYHPIRPNIARIEQIKEGGIPRLGLDNIARMMIYFNGEFRYFGITKTEENIVFCGGGNLEGKLTNKMRGREIVLANCFTGPLELCDKHFPRKSVSVIERFT